MSFPDHSRGRLARWLFWPQHRSGTLSHLDVDGALPPWPGLLEFERGRLALAAGRPSEALGRFAVALDEPLVRLPAAALGAYIVRAKERRPQRAPSNIFARTFFELLEEPAECVSPLLLREVGTQLLLGGRSAVQPGLAHLWEGSDWALVGSEVPFAGPRLPDPVLFREFEAGQQSRQLDLVVCLPDRGAAWLKARGYPPTYVLPQAARVIVAVMAGEDPAQEVLGPDATGPSWAKLLSRVKRDLAKGGAKFKAGGGELRLHGKTMGLVCEASLSTEKRLRRMAGPLPHLWER